MTRGGGGVSQKSEAKTKHKEKNTKKATKNNYINGKAALSYINIIANKGQSYLPLD